MSSSASLNLILTAVLSAATTAFLFAVVFNPLRKTRRESRCAKKGKVTENGLPSGATQTRKSFEPSKAALVGDEFGGRLLEK